MCPVGDNITSHVIATNSLPHKEYKYVYCSVNVTHPAMGPGPYMITNDVVRNVTSLLYHMRQGHTHTSTVHIPQLVTGSHSKHEFISRHNYDNSILLNPPHNN